MAYILQVKLTEFRSLPPLFEDTPNAVQELTLASNILYSISWDLYISFAFFLFGHAVNYCLLSLRFMCFPDISCDTV